MFCRRNSEPGQASWAHLQNDTNLKLLWETNLGELMSLRRIFYYGLESIHYPCDDASDKITIARSICQGQDEIA